MINKNLGLSIVGGSSGIFSARPLFLNSNIENKNLNLYLKNTKINSGGVLKSETNWNIDTLSNDIVSRSSYGRIEYSMTDFSSNKYDLYYDSYRGQSQVSYTISSDWSINKICGDENLLVLANKEWTSVEKYTTEIEDNIIACYISPINYYRSTQSSSTYTLYEVKIDWASSSPYCITSGGILTITYEYGTEERTLDITIPASSVPGGSETIYTTSESVSYSYSGSDGWPQPTCLQFTTIGTSTIELWETTPPPLGSIQRGSGYILPSELDPKLSRFLIPVPVTRFKDDNFNWMNFNQPNAFEVPDYSDIFFDITYDYNTGPNSNYLYGIVEQNDQRKIYSFGGFIRINDFINGLFDHAVIGDKTTITDDTDYKWYIIVKDDGEYYSVGLSNYVTWNYEYKTEYPYPESALLSFDAYEIVDYRFISVQKIKIVKTAVFPKCGKVDIFRPAKGTVQSFSGFVITSDGHGLSTGDQIKIAGGRGNGSNINGLRYVSVIDNNRFSIYYDSELNNPCTIINTSSGGIEWKSINGSSWKYLTSIYSPMGKNGYSLNASLNTTSENISGNGHLIDIAIESSTDKPHSNLKGLISWNNYYPFERFNETDDIIFEIINGNKFGSSIAFCKNGSDYILAVSETGANESFPIISPYETSTEEYKPRNKRLVPYYFPYGRIHLFTIDSSYNITYNMSYSRNNNPWEAYENANRNDKFYTFEYNSNLELSQQDLVQYQNTAIDYWNGARHLQWAQSYYYNSGLQFDFPDHAINLNYYGFLDNLGKDISIVLADGKINVMALTNVKNIDIPLTLMSSIYCHFQIDKDMNIGSKILSYGILDSRVHVYSIEEQKREYAKLNKTIALQDKNIINWGSNSIFVYTLFSEYTLSDQIFCDTETIEASHDLMVVNSNSSFDVYQYIQGKYHLVDSMDSVQGGYSIYGDLLITKSSEEYRGYIFNRLTQEYEHKFSKPNNLGAGEVLIMAGNSPSFFDTSTEYDIGDIHNSLNVISVGKNGVYNYISGMDIQKLEYLPLIVKTNEEKNSNISLYQLAGGNSSSGMELFLSPITPTPSSVELFVKQLDSTNEYINLFTCVEKVNDSGTLNLSIGSHFYNALPLINKGYSPDIYFKDGHLNLHTLNRHPNIFTYPPPYSGGDPTIPDGYGVFPLFMKTNDSEAKFSSISLYMNPNGNSQTGSLKLYLNSDTNFSTMSLAMNGSGYGYNGIHSEAMPLYIGRNPENGLSLVVYNTTTTGNLPIIMSGGLTSGSGMNLSISGYHLPNSVLHTYMRGAL